MVREVNVGEPVSVSCPVPSFTTPPLVSGMGAASVPMVRRPVTSKPRSAPPRSTVDSAAVMIGSLRSRILLVPAEITSPFRVTTLPTEVALATLARELRLIVPPRSVSPPGPTVRRLCEPTVVLPPSRSMLPAATSTSFAMIDPARCARAVPPSTRNAPVAVNAARPELKLPPFAVSVSSATVSVAPGLVGPVPTGVISPNIPPSIVILDVSAIWLPTLFPAKRKVAPA